MGQRLTTIRAHLAVSILVLGCSAVAAAQPGDAFSAWATIGGDILVPPWSGRAVYGTTLWPSGTVPYEFDANVTDVNADQMALAMMEWESIADVHFVQRSNETNYLHIQDSTENSSSIGMVGGAQPVRIFNWPSRFIIAHELGHALGLWHEQSRSDRDDFIAVHLEHVEESNQHNFDIEAAAVTYGSYDFDSVMHYGQCSFASDCLCPSDCQVITVLPPNEDQQDRIGQRSHLSDGDQSVMAFLYGATGPGPAIALSPISLSFSAVAGGPNPSSEKIEVWNTGSATLSWTATDNRSWLTVAPGAGSSTGEHDDLDVSVSAAGLAPGNYNGVITLEGTGASNSPRVVAVYFNVLSGGSQPVLCVSPPELDFGVVPKNFDAEASFFATNCGGGVLTGSASGGGPFDVINGSSFSLSRGATAEVVIRFIPPGTATYFNSIVFETNAGADARSVTGEGGATQGTAYSCETPYNISCGQSFGDDIRHGHNSYEKYCALSGPYSGCQNFYDGPEQVHRLHLKYQTDVTIPFCIVGCNNPGQGELGIAITTGCTSGQKLNETAIALNQNNGGFTLNGLAPGDYFIIIDSSLSDELGEYEIGPIGCVGPADGDQDGTPDSEDNCAAAYNPDQLNTDVSDSFGDACDNCAALPNQDQLDFDVDGRGDICDVCPDDAEDDGDIDGWCAKSDNCPAVFNPDQIDADHDGVGDQCDTVYNLFADGFETGNLTKWSAISGG